jgi:uncharacterized membrane protein YfcA
MAPISLVFIILGIAFVAIGLSDEQTFLWSGISFLVIGLMGLARRRKESAPAPADKEKQPELEDSNR